MYRFLVRTIILLLSMTTFLALTNTSRAQENTPKILAPIGGGYEFALQDLLTIVHSKNPDETINILVLPIAYATNPNLITAEERNANQKDAEMRRGQIEQMCRDRISTGVTCNVTLAEIYIHSDAEDSQVLNLFNESLTMIFILGGQQDIAMQLLQGTVLENELAKAYQKGVIIAGTSAGAALQSRTMIAGFTPGFNEKNAMQFGALEIWNNTELRGLAFGIQDAIIDQHFFQYGRMGRLLNAISMPDQPHLGIGIDAETGAIIQDGDMLSEVFGKYTLAILDAETYHAADRVIYRSTKNIIGMKNILYHMLSPSSYTYDIHNRQHSLAAPLPQINRQFRSLSLPVGAGPLILGGDLESSIGGHPALNRFVNLSGGLQAKILILVGGFKNDLDMQQLASSYGIAMGIPYQTFYLDSEFTISATISNFSGMLVIGKDPEVLKPLLKNIIAPAWRSGIPLMLDKEVSATVGKKYTTSIANMKNPELAAQMELIKDKTPIVSGIGLVNFNVEPLLNSDNRWGRLTALAYSNPDTLAIGIPEASAIIIAQDGITIDGYDALMLLDFRNARVDLGNNEGFVFANALIDIYAPGDSISSQIADSEFVPVPPATPVIPSPTLIPNSPTPTMTPTNTPTATTTPTPTVTIGPKGPPTKTLKPTNTPPAIPPPADPNRENIMILLVFLLAIVVFVGVWINRRVLR